MYQSSDVFQPFRSCNNRVSLQKKSWKVHLSASMSERPSDTHAEPLEDGDSSESTAQQQEEAKEGSVNLIINYLPANLRLPEYRAIFGEWGEISHCRIVRDLSTPNKRSKGYGFVRYVHLEDAQRVVDEMNGFELNGRKIKVSLATSMPRPEDVQKAASAGNEVANQEGSSESLNVAPTTTDTKQ